MGSSSTHRDAADLVRTIMKAVQYIHASCIVHRGTHLAFHLPFPRPANRCDAHNMGVRGGLSPTPSDVRSCCSNIEGANAGSFRSEAGEPSLPHTRRRCRYHDCRLRPESCNGGGPFPSAHRNLRHAWGTFALSVGLLLLLNDTFQYMAPEIFKKSAYHVICVLVRHLLTVLQRAMASQWMFGQWVSSPTSC